MGGTIISTVVHESTLLIIGVYFSKFKKLVYYLILKREKNRDKQKCVAFKNRYVKTDLQLYYLPYQESLKAIPFFHTKIATTNKISR